MDHFVRMALKGGSPGRRIAYPLSIGILCAFQLWIGWNLTSQVNSDPDAFDQGSYMLMAETMAGSWFPWYSDGTRNPLLPWIAQGILDPSEPGFFSKAKRLSVVLGVLGTGGLGFFFRRRMGPLAAWNATALAALALLLPCSTFFGAEVVFYPLFLLVFVLGARLLNQNPLRDYFLLGVLGALASLAKASVTPLLLVFFFWSLARLALQATGSPLLPAARDWSARRFWVGTAMLVAAYAALMAPRMVHSQQTWGTPFYSLPSHWMWADDWKTCVEKYTDCRPEVIASMPPEERPTLSGYFLRNSPSDALERLRDGVQVRLGQFLHPEAKWRVPFEKRGRPKSVVLPHRGFYLVGLGLLAIAMGAILLKTRRPGPWPSMLMPALYFLSAWVLYTCATGWYHPTGPGHRFILTLYLPTLWAVALGADQLREAANSRPANFLFLASHLLIAGLLASRLGILLLNPEFKKISFTF